MITAAVALPFAIQLLLYALSVALADPCAQQIGSLQLQLEAKESALGRCGRLVQELRVELAALRSVLDGAGDGRPDARRVPQPAPTAGPTSKAAPQRGCGNHTHTHAPLDARSDN